MLTYFDIVAAMRYRTEIELPDGRKGYVNGIRPEDGSGRCWLITLLQPHNALQPEVEVFWREPK